VQRDGLRLIARCRPENLIITLTDNSKTILYVIATLLPRAEVTVVIVPLIALRQDLLRRCEQWGISFRRWPDGAVLGQLLFVGIDCIPLSGEIAVDRSTPSLWLPVCLPYGHPSSLCRIGIEGTAKFHHARNPEG
jgi:hypothetical protein